MTLARIADYQDNYIADYGFEAVLVHYRQRLVMERLGFYRPSVVVEIGCGSDMLYDAWHRAGHVADQWIVVEPAAAFAQAARDSKLPHLEVIEDLFEDALPQLRSTLVRAPDVVICTALLQEVPSSSRLLRAIHDCMGPQSVLHVSVANAGSLHRQLARSMGLISDLKEKSERNLKLEQREVYDMASLGADLSASGFAPGVHGGYFIKPFTHGQMAGVAPIIGDPVLDGMYELGKELPELASEIYIDAKLATHG